MSNKEIQMTSELRVAVQTIKTAILQSQARAVKGVNQEQLALYYGVGRYISENTRNQKWESGAIETISLRLRQELPGLRGFGVSSLKNMRLFYGAWNVIEPKSPIAIGDLAKVLTPKEELQRIFEEETEQMNVLDSVLENVLETSASLAWHFKVDARTIRRDLSVLQTKGFNRHDGSDKGRRWVVVKG